MMIEFLAKTCSALGISGFIFAMVGSWALRYMIDKDRVKGCEVEVFRSVAPPRKVLTPLGVKVWWARWIAVGLFILFILLSHYLFEKADERPNQSLLPTPTAVTPAASHPSRQP